MDFELLVLGDTGWGDEMLRASLVTLLVSLSAMGIGLLISILGTMSKLSSKFNIKCFTLLKPSAPHFSNGLILK